MDFNFPSPTSSTFYCACLLCSFVIIFVVAVLDANLVFFGVVVSEMKKKENFFIFFLLDYHWDPNEIPKSHSFKNPKSWR